MAETIRQKPSSGDNQPQSISPHCVVKPLRPYRINFLYIAQPHQTLHSLPMAFELAQAHPELDIHVTCITQHHLSYIHSLATLYDDPPITYELLPIPKWLRQRITWRGPGIVKKLLALFLGRKYFSHFDALVVPERTSLYLRRFGVKKPRYIYTQHGAGDRAVGFAKDIKEFDFVFVPGSKIEQRFLQTDLAKSQRYHKGTYVKFDIVRRLQKHRNHSFFDNDRPTVLYNPHFFPHLSSWYSVGHQVLEFFAHQDKYNLICAPHYRLFNGAPQKGKELVERFKNSPNILIDPGSPKSIDMTYTMAADIYLGDVSSQVAEFLIKERPCIFINPNNKDWEDNDDYLFWRLGQVINNVGQLQNALDVAEKKQKHFAPLQQRYYQDTFDYSFDSGPTAPDAADAIIRYLNREVRRGN